MTTIKAQKFEDKYSPILKPMLDFVVFSSNALVVCTPTLFWG